MLRDSLEFTSGEIHGGLFMSPDISLKTFTCWKGYLHMRTHITMVNTDVEIMCKEGALGIL